MTKKQKPLRVLNLYAGLGGNRRLWENVDVVAVENFAPVAKVYADNFPGDKVILGDASEYLEKNFRDFDFIWSSPPCPTHSVMSRAARHTGRKIPDMTLYGHILFLQNFFAGEWVVENVRPYYTPLIPPTVVLSRHLFWASRSIRKKDFKNPFPNFIRSDSPESIAHMKKIFGLRYDKNIYFPGRHSPGQALRNCVLPDLGRYVFDEILFQKTQGEKKT